MKWLNGYRMRLVLVGVVAAIMLSGGNVRADFIFGECTELGPPIKSPPAGVVSPEISVDGLSFFFARWVTNDSSSFHRDLWMATRATAHDTWNTPINLGPTVNSSSHDDGPHVSHDGLELYFASDRPGGSGSWDIWMVTRATIFDPWGTPINLGPMVNSAADEIAPSTSSDGLGLYFSGYRHESARPGGYGQADLWVTTRPTRNDPWGEPVNLGPVVNSSRQDARPCLSSDGLLLIFDSQRSGGDGYGDLYMTRRASLSDPWQEPVNLGPVVNSLAFEEHPDIAADGSTLFFNRALTGYPDSIWQAPIIPIVDLNGDGIVDAADMCIMIDHWGEDYSLCDIGPMPWGDGIVDVEDLIVLAEHLFEEVPPVE